jgi:hypothetical protein
MRDEHRWFSWIRNNILGMVAIFIALSGSAAAATVVIKHNSNGNPRAGASKKAKAGPRGPAGAQGATGSQGRPGEQGPGGSEAWHELGNAQAGVCTANGNFCSINAGFDFHNLGSGFSTGAYLRDPTGTVHLKGVVQRTGVSQNRIFYLPAGYLPAQGEVFTTTSNNAPGTIYINSPVTPAAVTVNVGDPDTWISLDGISFRCEPSGADGCP